MAERGVRWVSYVFLGLMIAAWGLRLYRLDAQSLWYDEGVTAQLVRQGLTELTRWTADDIQPPLYYYIVAGWVRLVGVSEWALRFPSAAWGVLIVPLIYALGRRLYGTMAGSLAALLASGAPLYVYYSQEARMYTQLTALGLVVTYVLVRALQTGDDHARRRWWVAFVGIGLAAVYTHYFAFFLLVALALATGYWLLIVNSATLSSPRFPSSRTLPPRTLLRESVLVAVVTLLGYLPWLPFVLHRYRVDASYWQGQLKLGEALRHVWINFTLGAPQTTLERDAIRISWGFAVVVALALVGLLWRSRGRPTGRIVWTTMVLLSYLLVPVVLILILSSRTPKFNPRYLMLASPAFWLFIAGGLNALIHLRSSLNPHSFPGPTAETAPHAASGATADACPGRQAREKVPPQSPPWRRRHRGEPIPRFPAGGGQACSPPLPVCAAGEPVPRFPAGGLGVGAIFRTASRISAVIALIAVAFVLTIFAWADHSWFTDPRFTKPDFRRAATFVRKNIAGDEAVLLVSGHMSPVWDYYAGDLSRLRLPDMDVLDVNAVLGYDIGERLADALAGKQGAWLILWQDEVVDPNGVVTDILEQAGEELPVKRSFWHIGVRHFRWPTGARFSGQPSIAYSASVNFGARLWLLGHSQGDDGELRLYWQAQTALADDLKVTGELVDAAGHVWGRLPDRRLAAYEYPTFRWRPGQVILGRYALPADPGTPPGEYRLRLSVYPEGGPPLEVLDASGAPQGRRAFLSPVRVPQLVSGLPDLVEGRETEALSLAQYLDAPMAPGLTLLGVGALPEARIPGDLFPLETWWRAESALTSNLALHLWWEPAPVGMTDDQRLELPVGPLTGDVPYPSQKWPIGAMVRGQRTVQVPREAPAGELSLSGQVVDGEGHPAGRIVVLGTVQVMPVERTFQAPPVTWPSGAIFGGRVRLVGVDVATASARPGESVPVIVVWQAMEAMDRSYTAFVHLLGPDGRVVAQEDHVPGRGARPTTSWLPGEVIVDRFDLALPGDLLVGDYELEIGLYDAGQPDLPRLSLNDGGDAARLGRLSVMK